MPVPNWHWERSDELLGRFFEGFCGFRGGYVFKHSLSLRSYISVLVPFRGVHGPGSTHN